MLRLQPMSNDRKHSNSSPVLTDGLRPTAPEEDGSPSHDAGDGQVEAGKTAQSRLRFGALDPETAADTQSRTLLADTVANDSRPDSAALSSGGLSTTSSIDGARFVPGTLFGGRYRLSGLLGRGGMGEVYRAEDLKLGEPVALKLLPETLSYDGAALARFHREVRVARQIAHPNVCRVFDIGEAEGVSFLVMELIDGEDLASLLRRIGRLSPDKALDLARQICAGLSAVHERGILHRDLKPANVMIDREGRAKITDFGLSHWMGEGRESEIAGTPAYMAPEVIEGRAGRGSDLYSLALVLFEMLTGRRMFAKSGVMERIRAGNRLRVELDVEGLAPEIESLIERCLDLDEERRPKSALEVLLTLSGGDPLQAALDAGETPSPEMVAGARRRGTLPRKVAYPLLAVLLTSLATLALSARPTTVLGLADAQRSPAVLVDLSRTLLADLGWASSPQDRAHGFELDEELHQRWRNDDAGARWSDLESQRPSALSFWYRESPEPLAPIGRWQHGAALDDPPRTVPGMATVELDLLGRLQGLHIVADPGQLPGPVEENSTGDAISLLAQAGLQLADLVEVEPGPPPPVFADLRRAWVSTSTAGASETPAFRVEAAWWAGRPVFFEIVASGEPDDSVTSGSAWWLAMNGFFLLLWVAGLAQAHRNLVLGRGDRNGAYLLFLVGVLGSLGAWILEAHHTATVDELQLLFSRLASALMRGALLWVLYIALEPTVRRRWPSSIVSWSRLLSGDRRDPLVGRDLLLGLTGYLGLHAIAQVVHWGLLGLGIGAPTTIQELPLKIAGFRHAAASFLGAVTWLPVLTALGVLFLLVTLRRWMPPRVASATLGVMLLVLAWADPAVSLPGAVAYAVAMAWAAERGGLLALTGIGVAVELVVFAPLTLDSEIWYFSSMLLGVATTAALGVWACRRSIGDLTLLPRR